MLSVQAQSRPLDSSHSFKFRRRFCAYRSEGICERINIARRRRPRVVVNAADEGRHGRGDTSRLNGSEDRNLGGRGRTTAEASPATRLSAGSAPSSTGGWTGSGPTGGRAPTATWRPTSSSCRPPAPRRGSDSCSCGGGSIPTADDPLFRPIDADDFRTNGEHASDFSNLRQNGLVRITFDLPPNMRLIDPVTNQPSAEASSTCGAWCRRSTTWR